MAGPQSDEKQLSNNPSHGGSQENASDEESTRKDETPRKPSLPKRIWGKSGFNVGMLITMFRGALPPTIAIALYQSTGFAETFSTIGYLVAITSILSFAIMPRAKFFQTMSFNIIGVCLGSCTSLLSIYCSVQARAHTTPRPSAGPTSAGPSPGASVASYNSSASAVSAVWLFFNIYVSNTLRASRPQLQFPVIMYSIFANVASTYAPQFATMAQGIAFVKRLLEAFLTGLGIASGVSYFVFPLTSRTVVLKTAAGLIGALRGALEAQTGYLESLERKDVFTGPAKAKEKTADINRRDPSLHQKRGTASEPNPEAKALKAAVATLAELQGKISGDLPFAKREVAYGKLDASEISELSKLLRNVMLPVIGMSSVADIFDRTAERRGWKNTSKDDPNNPSRTREIKDKEIGQWNEIMKTLHRPFNALTEAMNQGLEHALYTLELAGRPKERTSDASSRDLNGASSDVEAKGNVVEPGDKGFGDSLSARIDKFIEQRKLTLNTWGCQHGLDLVGSQVQKTPASEIKESTHREREQRQLYLILYMEFLLWSTGRAILDLVRFADDKVESGVMKRKRFISPGMKRIRKWFLNALSLEDSSVDHTPDSTEFGDIRIEVGDAYRQAKDPEHLFPTNAFQRFGNGIRVISRILGSQESAFGFRVACATLSIGIVAYLRDTQAFFIQQRLVWAMIMVSIGMTVTAGAGVFGFIGRVTGTSKAASPLIVNTSVAMCTSYLIWYIVDGRTPGVIVLLFVFTFGEFYFVLRYPRFIVIALLTMVTQVLVIGYELQVKKVGEKVAESSGQPVYPLYKLAPYRLACVAGGMLVAFIWTFFPYPLTARSQLRKDLGASLYLLANFYSCVHTTVGMRLSGGEGPPDDKESPGRRLEKARTSVFTKELALLAGLRQHSNFTAWEPTIGGKFPRQQYDTIIHEVQNVLNYVALISYASNILSNKDQDDPDKANWLKTFSRLVRSIDATSQGLTSTLTLLSASVANGNPLPPYIKAPEPYGLSAKLEKIDADILNVSHVTEPGYAAFAVMQIASSLISDDIGKLISNVKSLVGEVDFSFHVVPSPDDTVATKDSSKGKKD